MTGKIALPVIGAFLAATLLLPESTLAGGRAHRGFGHSQGHFHGQHQLRGHGDFRHGHGYHPFRGPGPGHFRSFRHHQHFRHFPVHPGPHFGVHGGWRWTGWSWVWIPGHWR